MNVLPITDLRETGLRPTGRYPARSSDGVDYTADNTYYVLFRGRTCHSDISRGLGTEQECWRFNSSIQIVVVSASHSLRSPWNLQEFRVLTLRFIHLIVRALTGVPDHALHTKKGRALSERSPGEEHPQAARRIPLAVVEESLRRLES